MSVAAQRNKALPNDTLARFGSTVVTAAELVQRMEAVPFPGSLSGPVEEIKKKALRTLIAEKLLGQEAARLGLRNEASAQLMDRELENLFIRDALFKHEVTSAVHLGEDEIARGMRRLPFEFQVLSFLVRDKAQGTKLAAKLRTSGRKDILSNVSPTFYKQVDTIRLRFGARDTAYEEAVFSIGSNRVSRPFLSTNFGWAVLYILDRVTNPETQKQSFAERRRKAEKILRDKKEEVIAGKFYFGLLQSQRANAERGVFLLLADSLSALWREDTARFKKNNGYILTSDMVEVLMDRLSPYRDSTLVRFDDGTLSLGQVLEMFRYEDYISTYYEGEEFLLDLNQEVKNLAAREMLAREGRRRGLQDSPAVRKDLSVWTASLNAGALYHRVRDTVRVADADLLDHLMNNKELFGPQFEVNVREVLCPSAAEMEFVLAELHKGVSLEQLAFTRSIRPQWSARGGESGFFPVIDHPEIGFRALLADSGTIIGPVSLLEGESVFTMLGRRRTENALTEFDSLRHNIAVRLLAEKRKLAMDRAVASLARRQKVTIDYEKLKRVKVTLIPTFTRRYIGFGGRMTAVPLMMQLWDWENVPVEQLP